jgi:hypothetical protein
MPSSGNNSSSNSSGSSSSRSSSGGSYLSTCRSSSDSDVNVVDSCDKIIAGSGSLHL